MLLRHDGVTPDGEPLWAQHEQLLSGSRREAEAAAKRIVEDGTGYVVTPARSWKPLIEIVEQVPQSKTAAFDPLGSTS